MSSQTSKNGSRKKSSKKTPMDSEVTRIVLIFLLLLVIIVLLVAAFMSLGHGAESTNPQQGHVINIEVPTDTAGETAPPPVETVDPNHGNTETQPIPAEVLNPELATTESIFYIENTQPVVETAPPIDHAGEIAIGETTAPVVAYTTTGTRPENPNPVYIATTDPYAGIATLAPPLTTAGGNNDTSNGITTVTTTVSQAEAGEVSNTNYVTSLSGSTAIYSSPGGSSNGTVGSSGSFTIVQEMVDSNGVKWGKLKSGAGWVRLN